MTTNRIKVVIAALAVMAIAIGCLAVMLTTDDDDRSRTAKVTATKSPTKPPLDSLCAQAYHSLPLSSRNEWDFSVSVSLTGNPHPIKTWNCKTPKQTTRSQLESVILGRTVYSKLPTADAAKLKDWGGFQVTVHPTQGEPMLNSPMFGGHFCEWNGRTLQCYLGL